MVNLVCDLCGKSVPISKACRSFSDSYYKVSNNDAMFDKHLCSECYDNIFNKKQKEGE